MSFASRSSSAIRASARFRRPTRFATHSANPSGSIHHALFEQPPQPGNPSTIALSTGATGFVGWRHRHAASRAETPREVDHGQSWSLYFRDPDGNPYEITTYEHAAATTALLDDRAGTR